MWIDELGRHVERLQGCEGRVFVAMLDGGAGTLASLGEAGLATQERMAALLGLAPRPLPALQLSAQAEGDHATEYGQARYLNVQARHLNVHVEAAAWVGKQ
jgi:adenylosuccinate lyase